jgi:tRNA (cytidine56-2'-O)-methyltransferase
VDEAWGGSFGIRQVAGWKAAFREARNEGRTVVHLTMYGMPVQDKIAELTARERFLIAVGGPKVPGEVYKLADYNIAVTSQPHSEVAALAIVLHELQRGEELKKEFGPAKMKIVPSEKGKRVEKLK